MDATQNKARMKRVFSLRYWLRRWLVPELELSPCAVAAREAEILECEAMRASILARFDARHSRPVVEALPSGPSLGQAEASGRLH